MIPIDDTWPDEEKSGWIVDGQQRSAAIREANIGSFPILITAFITDSDADQRSQFILVNSTKPLTKGLIYELLPATQGTLPGFLQTHRFPAHLLERLNHDPDSPLNSIIHRPTTPDGVIKENSILRMLANSISDGAPTRARSPHRLLLAILEQMDAICPRCGRSFKATGRRRFCSASCLRASYRSMENTAPVRPLPVSSQHRAINTAYRKRQLRRPGRP